eukprot:1620004-Rhodomonas_salina.1
MTAAIYNRIAPIRDAQKREDCLYLRIAYTNVTYASINKSISSINGSSSGINGRRQALRTTRSLAIPSIDPARSGRLCNSTPQVRVPDIARGLAAIIAAETVPQYRAWHTDWVEG